VNLLIDATFFGREYGYLCFHDTKRIIYFKETKNENVRDLQEGLLILQSANYKFKSITIDGRRGYYNNIRKILGNIPIQMCIFHQKAIIRRYITDKPKSRCGQELKELAKRITDQKNHQLFINNFYKLKEKYQFYLHERNKNGDFKHQALRSAFKSLESNLSNIFVYSDNKTLNIPPTNNHLEGIFGHLKERIKIHRGLLKNRKKKAVKFLLRNLGNGKKKK
jgi:aspartyl-tRNA synthetase